MDDLKRRWRPLFAGAVVLLFASVLMGCYGDEQAAIEPGADRSRTPSEPAPVPRAGQTELGENLIGRRVVDRDDAVLGTVVDWVTTGTGLTYAVVESEGGARRPIPAEMLQTSPGGAPLRSEFDQATFGRAPAYSQQEWSQLSDEQFQELRGYYEMRTPGVGPVAPTAPYGDGSVPAPEQDRPAPQQGLRTQKQRAGP